MDGPDLDALDHERYMDRALELAREAAERGDGPYGSLLVLDGEVVAEASNRTVTDDDLALHPELTLAREAGRDLSADERSRTVMYTSTEPCPMCSGGIAIAGLGAVVFGISGAQAADLTGGTAGVPCEEVCRRWGREVEVTGPVLSEESAAVHREYR